MLIEKFLRQPSPLWLEDGEKENEIVLASRVRLARNLKKHAFPNVADNEALAQVVAKVRGCFAELQAEDLENNKYHYISLHSLSDVELGVLVAQHAISPTHAERPENRALILRDDMRVSIMINEEDHLRIQTMQAGLALDSAYEIANRCDDILERKLDYAFDDEFGFLTSCPTNVGTGLRTSVMLHLPALTLAKRIKKVVSAVKNRGLVVRGLYGEGSEAVGNIFQLSNQLTFGHTEKELIDNVCNATKIVIEQEKAAREVFVNEAKDFLNDKVWRAYGVLAHLRSVSWQEALTLLSLVRMGADMGIIKDFAPIAFNKLLVMCSKASLDLAAGDEKLEQGTRRKLRAEIIKKQLHIIS